MLPNRCSIIESNKQCTDPPARVVSIVSDDGEYMVGVSCERHSETFLARVRRLQDEKKLQEGRVKLEPLSAVGTDCIRGDADDLITPQTGESGGRTCQ